MFGKYKMTDREKCELEEFRGLNLSPRQIRAMKREIERQRDYIEWLENL